MSRVSHLSDDEFFTCKHARLSNPRQRTLENGSIVYQRQCIDCGSSKGNLFSKANAQAMGTVYLFDEEFYRDNQQRRKDYSDAFFKNRDDQREAARLEYREWYYEYLQSDKWRAKRAKVIKRCGDVCEGCGEKPVTQVHHLTYAHAGDELLFELVGLCDDCHELSHSSTKNKPSHLIHDEFPVV
jgi:hypothetical protein